MGLAPLPYGNRAPFGYLDLLRDLGAFGRLSMSYSGLQRGI